MSWVRLDQEILPRPSTHTSKLFDTDRVEVSQKAARKYRTNLVLNPGPVMCKSITLSARPQPIDIITSSYDLNTKIVIDILSYCMFYPAFSWLAEALANSGLCEPIQSDKTNSLHYKYRGTHLI